MIPDVYIGCIHAEQQVFLKEPGWGLPRETGSRGRPIKKARANKPSFRVDEYCKAPEKEDWAEIRVRNTVKGMSKGCTIFVLH